MYRVFKEAKLLLQSLASLVDIMIIGLAATVDQEAKGHPSRMVEGELEGPWVSLQL